MIPQRTDLYAALLLAPLSCWPVLAHSEEEEEEETESVVVVATRSEALVRDQPIRVEVLPEEEIEENLTVQPGNLTSLLTELGGVHIQSTAAGLGGATLQMRGMPGRHTLVLQDGLPLLGAQPDAFGLLQTPPLDLGRVEVIKGVASALYGSGGLGGVLNLMSRKPGSEPEILLNRTSRGGTDAVGFVTDAISPEWGYSVTAGAHDQSREDIDDDGWADIAEYRRYTVRPRLFWENGEGASVFATLGLMDESRQGGSMRGQVLPDGTTFRDTLDSRRADAGLVTHMPLSGSKLFGSRWSFVRLERDRDFNGLVSEDVRTTGSGEATVSGAHEQHAWIAGVALDYDRFESARSSGVNYRYTVPAVFAQDEYAVSDAIKLAGSARVDDHNEYGTFVSPRLSALFRLEEDWSLRASIGSGFAAPTLVADETEATSVALVEPLRGLDAERATSASVDMKWAENRWEINGSVFGSRIRDPLVVRSSTVPGRLRLANADGPREVVGAELLVHYNVGDFHVIGSSTYLDATEAAAGGGRRDSELIPRFSGELAALFEDEERGRLGLEFSYTGKQKLYDNPYRSESKPYLEISALAEIKFGEVGIFLNAINLTDRRQTRFDPLLRPLPAATGERIVEGWAPLTGRVFNLGVRVEL
ncbi:TonB-dependent receptor plug domain-containing protein [Steroidobacter flavus]|uniref:TonB-dependent receptor plug domain-containing protein n=1 Tax=Steroidobacter flavus TaxID=1842136 RepID=A0ABV8T4A6_9GAMM